MFWIILLGICILAAVILFIAVRKSKPKKRVKGKYYEGELIGQGIAIGIPLGLVFGLALGNIAFGPGIGVAIGVVIGAVMEEKAKKQGKVLPLTKEQKQIKTKALVWVLGFSNHSSIIPLVSHWSSEWKLIKKGACD